MTPITDIYNTPPLKPVKILLVDDRQENLLALEVMLSNKNYDLVKATSGKEALKILMDEQDFALILIDVLMPIMDGFETAELIRQSKKLKSVPIIFLTAEIDAADNIFKGYQAGAVDYIFKPLSAEILNAKVTVFVDLYRKNNELLIRDKTLNALNSELEKNIQHLKENEELLKKSNERFLKIFAKNPVGMTFSDIKTNKIAYANDLFLTLFGYSREEIIGRTSAELKLVSAEEGARLLALILNYLKEKRTPAELQLLSIEEKEQLLVDLNIAMDKKGFEVEYTRKNGELFFASIWYEIIEVDGEKYTITSYQDITERKKNEEILNKRTQQLIEAQQLAHIGSWEWNIATNKIEWSDELYRIYGIQSHVLESNYENFLKYIHPEDKEYVNGIIKQAFKDHKPFNFFHRLILPNGMLRTLSCIGHVFADSNGDIIRMTGTVQDITAQKQAEEKTIRLIEDKNKAERAALVAEQETKSKQQFLSNMSHEIRTPMNAIIGFTKVMLETDLNEQQKEYLNAIKVSGDSLIVLINDILDLAKVNSGKMEFEHIPFKLSEAIYSTLLLFDEKIKESNLKFIKHFDDSIPEVLLGDPIRLRQIILNLLSNAVKFTTQGSITVNVELVKEDAESATIKFSVIDSGIGIPENKIKKIFDSFQQATNETTRLFGGTGLGLTIVKQLVEAQDGTITVESKVGEGSTFSFSMSFKKTEIKIEEEEDDGVKLIDGIKNVKVLVAEDVMLNQLLMKAVLEKFGFEVEMANNGKIAIEKLQKNKYDVVLMDVQMPEMDGIEATEYIRKSIHSKIPIIALTADVTTLDIEKCKNLGMNDYLSKPIDSKLLYNKISKYVKENQPSQNPNEMKNQDNIQKKTCTNLDFVRQMTNGNPKMIIEMLKVYLEETPILLNKMKQGVDTKDWDLLARAAHSIKPSLSTVGISEEFVDIVKKIEVYAAKKENPEIVKELFLKIELVCEQARKELEQELISLEKL